MVPWCQGILAPWHLGEGEDASKLWAKHTQAYKEQTNTHTETSRVAQGVVSWLAANEDQKNL